MANEDRRVKRFYVVKAAEITTPRQVSEEEARRDVRGYGQIRLSEPVGTSRGGFKLGDYLPKQNDVLICGQETSVDEQGEEWCMPIMESIFCYDPTAKREVFRGANLSPGFQKYLQEKDFAIGKITHLKNHMLETRFQLDELGVRARTSTRVKPEEIDFNKLRAFLGKELAVVIHPKEAVAPLDIYHGSSGRLLHDSLSSIPKCMLGYVFGLAINLQRE
jgi:hypothetical protein